MSDINIELPEIFPNTNVTVQDEEHIFDVKEGSFEDQEQLEYTINKAPITKIEGVTGTVDGGDYEFEQGVDYELSNDSNRLVWLENEVPDDNTPFYITYRSESIISRFLKSSEEELEVSEEHLKEAIDSKFIDTAEGEELDELGKLFGPTIGQRRGRTDEEYRVYLRSVVQSFTSRGTKTGIKLAISAATDIPIEDIEIIEDFYRNEYSVGILPQTPVSGSLLENVAEIADPSGIKQLSTRFRPEPEETGVNDGIFITEGIALSELLSIDDVTDVNKNLIDGQKLDEDVIFDDSTGVNPDLTTRDEAISVDDDKTVNPNLFEILEDIQLDDAVESVVEEDLNDYKWSPSSNDGTDDNVDWDFFEWIELEDLGTFLIAESSGVADVYFIDRNNPATTDTSFSDDDYFIDRNQYTISDTSFSDDDSFVDRDKTVESEDVTLSDDTAIDSTDTADDVQSADEFAVGVRDKNQFRWNEYGGTEVTPDGDDWGLDWGTLEWAEGPQSATTGEWNFMEWTELVDLLASTSDVGYSDDSVLIDQNKLVVPDIGGSDDTALLDQNTQTTNDTTDVSDPTTETVRAINSFEWGQYEQTVIEPTGDEWDSNDWGTLSWSEGTDLEASATGDSWSFMEWTEA